MTDLISFIPRFFAVEIPIPGESRSVLASLYIVDTDLAWLRLSEDTRLGPLYVRIRDWAPALTARFLAEESIGLWTDINFEDGWCCLPAPVGYIPCSFRIVRELFPA